MIKLETTSKFRCETETEAKERMEAFREEAEEKGYHIKKMGYEYKDKKSKGEIIDKCYVLSITKIYSSLWI